MKKDTELRIEIAIRTIQKAHQDHLIPYLLMGLIKEIPLSIYIDLGMEGVAEKVQYLLNVLEDKIDHPEDDTIKYQQEEVLKYFTGLNNPFEMLTDVREIQQIIPDRKYSIVEHIIKFFQYILKTPIDLRKSIEEWCLLMSLYGTLYEGMTEQDLLLRFYKKRSRFILNNYIQERGLYNEKNDS